jgi:hypothetical protein
MAKKSVRRHSGGFFKHHSLSLVAAGIVALWILLFARSDPKTHWGSFFGNAVADWTGVLATVIATKYFYEIGSTESRNPAPQKRLLHHRSLDFARKHSLTIFLAITGTGWAIAFMRMDPDAKWGQVVGNIVSEWTQLLGLVLLTKRLIEDRSKESH